MKWTSDLYNKYKGQSCIIIGNGPSLRDVPLKFLQGNTTFGTNKIFLLKGFTPTFYVCVNLLVLKQSIAFMPGTSVPKFLNMQCPENVPDMFSLHSMAPPMFSYNPEMYVYEGYTVTFVCLQLAFFMGFKKVGLVGVDHRFEYEGDPNEERVMSKSEDDPNHFHPDYFKGQLWNNPDLVKSEEAYEMAKEAFEADGRKIFNLTKGTELKTFRKKSVDKW